MKKDGNEERKTGENVLFHIQIRKKEQKDFPYRENTNPTLLEKKNKKDRKIQPGKPKTETCSQNLTSVHLIHRNTFATQMKVFTDPPWAVTLPPKPGNVAAQGRLCNRPRKARKPSHILTQNITAEYGLSSILRDLIIRQ